MTSTHFLELNLRPPNENISRSELQAPSMVECYQETVSISVLLPTRLTGYPKFPNTYVTRNLERGMI
ncbi:unnamed protein product [Arabis nemorensis]|uniref:Uncharacterized protein n=1 Tax=Arabis nemorensis TaxID=586526 RepID=A0A565C6C1_9BRAS|nr:unnamed protein product [Arabis nemorensis]